MHVRATKKRNNGKMPVMMRIMINSKPIEIFTGIDFSPAEWEAFQTKKRLDESFERAVVVLENWEAEAKFEFTRLIKEGVHLTPRLLKAFLQGTINQYTLIKVTDEYLQFKVKEGKRKSTIKHLDTHRKHLKDFLFDTDQEGILINKVGVRFMNQYAEYLKTVKGFHLSYVRPLTGLIKSVIRYAHLYNYIKNDPLQYWTSPSFKCRTTAWLEEDELESILNAKFSDRLEEARDLFVFQIFTGMSYCDMMSFSSSMIIKGPDGEDWIVYERHKIENSRATLPLLDEAREVLERYRYNLPFMHGNIYNQYLREIARVLNFKMSRISSRVGRKTFGMLCLNRGVSLEVVAKCMGHASTEMTRKHYAFILDKTVGREMEAMKRRPGSAGGGMMKVV